MARFIDITGEKYGEVEVVSPAGKNQSGNMMWNCKCSCGAVFISSSYNIRKNKILTCEGCKKRVNEVGNKYGLLTVERLSGSSPDGRSIWSCVCECGGRKDVLGKLLRNGEVVSCGCIKSLGEKIIGDFLRENKFNFIKEHTFKDLRGATNRLLRFDFAVLNNNGEVECLIECDGIQHFKATGGWNTEENVAKTQINDAIKNKYCEDNEIRLYRFIYTKAEDLSKALEKWKSNKPQA